MLSRKGAARSPGARCPRLRLEPPAAGGGDGRWIKPLPAPSAPRGRRLSDPIPARDATVAFLGPGVRGESVLPPRAARPRSWGWSCRPPAPRPQGPSLRQDRASGPPEGPCGFGDPAPLLQALTSPTRHRGRSALPGNPPPPGLPAQGCSARPGRCGPEGEEQRSAEPLPRGKQPQQRPCVSAGRWDRTRVLQLRPPGYHFPSGPPRARPGPGSPAGRGISCGLGISRLPLSCPRFPGGCRGRRWAAEPTLPRAAGEEEEFSPASAGRQSPAAPLAAALGNTSRAGAAQPMSRRWL